VLRFVLDEVVAGVRSVNVSQIERRWRPRGHRADRRDSLLEISPTVYVRELVGHRPGRDRKVPCPFDVDERPSLHVYAAPEWLVLLLLPARRPIYDLAAEL